MSSILWRRLDVPGHDACRLLAREDGCALEGAATFATADAVACLAYRVTCDSKWRQQRGHILGWIGPRAVEWTCLQVAGVWTLNGVAYPDLEDCSDFDLGFTPATNLFQLRRIALALGAAADVPAAWLDVETGSLSRLTQRYERIGEGAYHYAAPAVPYEATLEVAPSGFVRSYPGLWVVEPGSQP